MVDLNQIQDFFHIISGALGGAASSALFKGPIQTLQDWWYVNYGYNISTQAALLKGKQEAAVEQLKNDILKEAVSIPPENVQQPNLKILGPSLEASRYYIEEEELRKMFAKIIASSLDNRKNSTIHTSFVEIIKQLDTLDARILKYLKENHFSVNSYAPTMRMLEKFPDSTSISILPLIFLTQHFNNFSENSVSLINLQRLGIINLHNDRWITDDNAYNYIKEHDIIKHILLNHKDYELEKSCFSLTEYGKNFIEICVN